MILQADGWAVMQTPSSVAARRLFRASLLHLPLFMGALMLHRIPQTQEERQPMQLMTHLRLGLSALAPQTWTATAAVQPQPQPSVSGGVLGALSVAPFPFLPVPLQLRCPSKVACEAGEEEEEKEQPPAAGSA